MMTFGRQRVIKCKLHNMFQKHNSSFIQWLIAKRIQCDCRCSVSIRITKELDKFSFVLKRRKLIIQIYFLKPYVRSYYHTDGLCAPSLMNVYLALQNKTFIFSFNLNVKAVQRFEKFQHTMLMSYGKW